MNLYEHTNNSKTRRKSFSTKTNQEKYSKIVEKFEGDVVKIRKLGINEFIIFN